MKTLLHFFIFIMASGNILSQTSTNSDCSKITSIIDLFKTWKQTDLTVRYPLLGKREKRQLNHTMLETGPKRYYSTAVPLGEKIGEFGMDETGHCSYLAYFGPYPKDAIDSEGLKLRKRFLNCLEIGLWKEFETERNYLFISYRPIDIILSIGKQPIQNSELTWLVVNIFRVTPK